MSTTPTTTSQHHSKPTKILQINLRHCKAASALLPKTIEDYQVDIAMIQEPYAIKNIHGVEPANVPPGFSAFYNLNDNHHFGSMILVKNSIKASMEKCSSNEITIVKVSSSPSMILLICAYCRPSSLTISSTIKSYLLAYEADLKKAVICLDANAKSPAWNSLVLDKKGKELENLLSRFHLKIANAKLASLNFIPAGTGFVDVTLVGCDLELNHWYFLQDHSLSDHPYILFDLAKTLQSPIRPRKSKLPRADDIDTGLFNKTLADELAALDNRHKAVSERHRQLHRVRHIDNNLQRQSKQKNNSETQPPLHGPMVDRRARNLAETHQESIQKMVSLTPDGRQAVLQQRQGSVPTPHPQSEK